MRGVCTTAPGRRAMLALAVAVLAGRPAGAQQVRELGADESVRLGLERNARVMAADADARAVRAGYEQARAGRLPAIRALASYTRLSDNIPPVAFSLPGSDSVFTFQAVELNRYDAELTVEQPLFTGFRLSNRIRAAAHDAEAARYTAEQERADVALEIRRGYWGLYRALAVRGAVAAALDQVREHLRQVRNRVTEGAALRRDLLSAETRESEVLLEQVEAENAVRVGQLELNRLMGLPLDTPIRPTSAVDTAALAADLAAEVQSPRAADLDRRPLLQARAAEVRGLAARVRAAQGGRLPELSLVGRYVHARPNPYFFAEQDRFRHSWEAGLSARWDPWQGGRVGAEAGEARARLQAAEARLADTRELVAVDVARQRLEVRRAGEALRTSSRGLAAAEESFRVARQQFDEGAALSSDVLEAEQAVRRARAQRAGALADYAVARAALLAALGRVW